ncbi:hypothetical protein TorRG33x02_185690 [Trema orientale]|uniref:Uncharacterized protein n=1 Tax=Trema orientale TaxID=63057 RepID=A0A2P5EJN1_TREOI|nr:hypothetical protein TorRG33x02_185690 [Trema orientale]
MSKATERLKIESERLKIEFARSSWVMPELEKSVLASVEGKWVLVRIDGFVAEKEWENGRNWAFSFWACQG